MKNSDERLQKLVDNLNECVQYMLNAKYDDEVENYANLAQWNIRALSVQLQINIQKGVKTNND